MSIELVANLSYILAAVLFIFGLKMLGHPNSCLLYTSYAADDLLCVDIGGRLIIKKK